MTNKKTYPGLLQIPPDFHFTAAQITLKEEVPEDTKYHFCGSIKDPDECSSNDDYESELDDCHSLKLIPFANLRKHQGAGLSLMFVKMNKQYLYVFNIEKDDEEHTLGHLVLGITKNKQGKYRAALVTDFRNHPIHKWESKSYATLNKPIAEAKEEIVRAFSKHKNPIVWHD